jgi:hypothetical protein
MTEAWIPQIMSGRQNIVRANHGPASLEYSARTEIYAQLNDGGIREARSIGYLNTVIGSDDALLSFEQVALSLVHVRPLGGGKNDGSEADSTARQRTYDTGNCNQSSMYALPRHIQRTGRWLPSIGPMTLADAKQD